MDRRLIWLLVGLCGAASAAQAAPAIYRGGRLVHFEPDGPPVMDAGEAADSQEEVSSPGPHGSDVYDDEGYVPDMGYGGHGAYGMNGCDSCGCGSCDCGSCCDPCGCDSCGHGGCGGQFWGRGEWLYWWLRASDAPPLVTTEPNGGVLPEAHSLFGPGNVDGQGRSGARVTIGYWLDDCETAGFEGNVWGFDPAGTFFHAQSDGSGTPLLARPFTDRTGGADLGPNAVQISIPGSVAGTINVQSSSELLGAEANFRRLLHGNCRHRLHMLAGYRFFRLDESLRVDTSSTGIGQSPQFNIDVTDEFGTSNQFHGGQLGVIAEWKHCRWTLETLAKLAVGAMSQEVAVHGQTTTTAGGSTAVNSGGFLALDSNIGTHDRSRYSMIPEFGVNLRCEVSCLWTASVGYSFMYVTNVARPADQIDLNLDTNQFPPAIASGTFPRSQFNDEDVWLQGLNLGIECRF